MLRLIRDGGFAMFFILFFGFVALGTAFWYALRPDAKHEGFIKWMVRATLYSICAATVADLTTVARFVVNTEMDDKQLVRIVIEGFGESMAPGILGFSFLSLTAFLAAVGRRRLDARKG